MIRRVLNSLLETPSTEVITYPNPFTKSDITSFGWLSNVAPCFPIKASDITILSEPKRFYEVIKNGCESAKKRIILVSLYLGTGTQERDLVDAVLRNESFRNRDLKVDVLLDFMRGSRFQINSRTLLQPLLNSSGNCEVSLYHTPCLRGFLKKITPERYNELFGLQHMKFYIFDNTLVISGANLSNDYFTNRQDRYFVIHDKRLCDFYSGLVLKVKKFSLKMDKSNQVRLDEDWSYLPYAGKKLNFVVKASDSVENYLINTREEKNSYKEEGYDTWIYPLVQMGQLGIYQDSLATTRILSEAQKHSTLCVATGYFNLTSEYMNTLIHASKANCEILMAHPRTNGFFGARGLAGGIPYAYSLIAKKFRTQLSKARQDERVKFWEYMRDNWTYHGKGLWYYPPNSKKPCLTLIGSPNFGARSVKRDLETQLAVVTENEELKEKFHQECSRLYEFGEKAELEREVPKWVHIFVLFFRTYF